MVTASAPSSMSSQLDPSLSLYQLLDPDVLADPYPLYRRLREHDPVVWDPYLHTWVVTDYSNIMTVLGRFSADRTPSPQQIKALGLTSLEPLAEVMSKQMLFLNAPSHTRLRKLCAVGFTSARIERLRRQIEDITDSLIDA